MANETRIPAAKLRSKGVGVMFLPKFGPEVT
jgi:hypothetical protein